MSSPQFQELLTPEYGTISYPSTSSSGTFPKEVVITPTTKGPTDIWRKPKPGGQEVNSFNAPAVVRKVDLGKFKSFRAKITANWETLYDQGGLLLVFPSSSSANKSPEEIGHSSRWIKTGIEFYNNNTFVSTVVRDNWSDWSLYNGGTFKTADGVTGVELFIERSEADGSLWIYAVSEGQKVPLREVTFVGDESLDREVWLGVFAATPEGFSSGDRKALEVKFEGIEWGITE